MKKKWIVAISIIVLASGLYIANLCLADDDDDDITSGSVRISGKSLLDMTQDASVTLVDAVQIAQEKVGGKAWSAELENENGFLVYDVEVVTTDRDVVDFIIDAGTGDILEMDVHNGNDDDDDDEEGDDDDDDEDDD